MNADVNTIVSGPRGPDGKTDNDRRLLLVVLELRQAGYDLARDWLTGPNGARYEHARVVRPRRRGAA